MLARGVRLQRPVVMAPLRRMSEETLREKVHPTIKGRSRFYKHVGVRKLEEDGPLKYEVTLDGRTLRTPGRQNMHFDSEVLAQAVALEWDAQGAQAIPGAEPGIEPATMPLMSLMSTWLDQTDPYRGVTEKNVLRYLYTDTCCFYADPELRVLLQRQREQFGNVLSWLENEWGICLATTDGLLKIKHPPEAIKRVETIVSTLDTAALTALQCATMESKSIAIALALVLRHLSVSEAIEASRLEEEFQMENWGLVEGGHDLDRAANKVQLTSASAFMHLRDGLDGHERRVGRLREALAA